MARRSRSPLVGLALFLVLALTAVACGNGDDDGAAGGTDVDLAGVTLNVAAVWSGEEQASFQAVLDEFGRRTGATVRFTSTGDDIAAVLGTAIQGGSPPDVAVLPQPGLLRQLGRAGNLVALDDIAGKAVDDGYAPVWRELATVDGKLYGVWFKASNKSTVWYNVAALRRAGIEPPKTWEEFVRSAQTILDSGVTPISVGGADGWTLTDWFENVYLRVAGPQKYDQLTTHAIPWTDQSVKDTLTTLGQLLGNPRFIAGGPSGALQVPFPKSVTQVFTTPPAAAIVYEGDFVAGNIKSSTTAKLGTDADFFPFPSVKGSKPAVVGGGDVAVLLRDTPGGRALIQYLASPAAAEIWAKRGGFTSPNKDVASSAYPDDITRRSAESLTGAELFRFDMSDLTPAAFGGTAGAGMWKILQDWLANPSAIDQTAQQLEAAAARAY